MPSLATQSVDVEPYDGSDDFGTPSYKASVEYTDVRVQDEGELTRDTDGNEVQSSGVLYVMGVDATSDFQPQSKVTLPDGSTEVVMKSAHKVALSGALEHTKVWF